MMENDDIFNIEMSSDVFCDEDRELILFTP